MKIAIVTDAWKPQINGVVTTLSQTGDHLRAMRHDVYFLTPETFATIPLPTYRSIRIAINPGRRAWRILDRFAPDAIHIATEGPLGFAARAYCQRRRLRFTTSYHTQFPHYIRMRLPIPLRVSYALQRWFHGAAERTMVPTDSQRRELASWGFQNLVLWSRGVDTSLFRPRDKGFLRDRRPIVLYAGRVAIEKNIEAFLQLDLPGSKYVVGDGPALPRLSVAYPEVRFVGFKHADELARYIAAADVFVFPSRTDTFGLVMLEAMACGVPVAAYPVTGPIDVVQNGVTGVLDDDLRTATLRALTLDGRATRAHALTRSWAAATEQFLGHLAPNRDRTQPTLAARERSTSV